MKQHTHRTSRLVGSALTIVLAATTPACVEASDEQTDAPIAKFAASERTTSEMGVKTWEVRNDGTEDHLTGRDASSERVVEMILHRDRTAAVETVDAETVFPGSGTVRLTAAGVATASSADARRLGLGVSSDLGPNAVRLEDGHDGLGTSVAASSVIDPRLDSQGNLHIGWNMFYQSQILTTPTTTCATNKTQHHGEIFSDFGSRADWIGWVNPTTVTDCTARFVWQVEGGRWDDFHWKVFNSPANLAAGKAASQSTTNFGGNAARAVDGNIDGVWVDNSVTHTDYQYRPWWMVDLGTSKPIGGVVVFNRTDSNPERLSDFDIFVSPDGANWALAAGMTGPALARTEFAMSTTGRFVAVQLRGTNYLSLAEVQVFAP